MSGREGAAEPTPFTAQGSPTGGTPDDRPFPSHWESDVVLKDGGTVHLRPIVPTDADLLGAFHERQSPQSVYYRFFSPRPRLSRRDLEEMTTVDYRDRMAFIALLGDEMVGVARYSRWRARNEAEVAFFVDDEHGHRGLATLLLEHLAAVARDNGLRAFTAQVLPENRKMLSVFEAAGFETASKFEDGVIEVRLDLLPTDKTLAAVHERELQSEAASVQRILSPTSIAVVGAGRSAGTIGHDVFRNLIDNDFNGPVFPVNPNASHVASVPTHPSLLDVPADVDLAVIAVPADSVLEVVEQCARKRVEGLIVLSAGFGESTGEGAARQRELVETARRHGMRLIGPNCLGVINTHPAVRMHAIPSRVDTRRGPIGFVSQSGSLGTAVLEYAEGLGLGLSTFVAVGNRADVSVNDLLQYWEIDSATEVILLYIESFGNLRKFTRIAPRVARRKPVVVVKSARFVSTGEPNRSENLQGQMAEALFRKTGLIRVDSIEELFDVARIAADQPIPRGTRVAIVGNSTGAGLLAADACVGAGLTLPELSDGTRAALADLDLDVVARNPIDLSHRARGDQYGSVLTAVLADQIIDAAIVVYAPPQQHDDEVARAVMKAAGTSDKTVIATYLGAEPSRSLVGERNIPVFSFPENASRALAGLARYGAWREQDPGRSVSFDDFDAERARSVVINGLDHAERPAGLGDAALDELLAAIGVRLAERRYAANATEAVEAADALGYPVVLKAADRDPGTRTEGEGLSLDIFGAEELSEKFRRMAEGGTLDMDHAVVQRMTSWGADVRVHLMQDPRLGSAIAVGLGGIASSADEAALAVLPLTDCDAEDLLRRSSVAGLMSGDGHAAMRDLLLRVAQCADSVPELAELELNPVIVWEDSAVVVDARATVAPWRYEAMAQVRRLDA